MIPWLEPADPFPPVDRAMRDPNGLLAAGGDLSPQRLLDAYMRGIFPWFGEDDPLLWWSPDPRMVLFLDELHVARSLRRVIRSGRYEVRFDTAFRDVMLACGEPRVGQDGTWITPAMIEAYTTLERLGYAHSIESWADGELVGGLYGVAIGRMFYGESMFTRRTDASKNQRDAQPDARALSIMSANEVDSGQDPENRQQKDQEGTQRLAQDDAADLDAGTPLAPLGRRRQRLVQ